ncbi:carboxypeptidase regulatory-like domain-containing protein [Fibrobacter sp. UWH4]|uniref:carboxypeptidase regulatory-like domain-containing protein n=1 Tax=Fibrobacter sp. UWH4 TaxID=1896210 RepID=UPI000917187C|nr:carboxypeptidase regulatory-like domain-containing protein [Fibrobacter sp. UWH4]SHK36204.1 CarboxypepD_reg-like domain-containing protein [Fibrobacter sp. UWH4]
MIKKDWFIAVAALLTASYFSACSVTDSESSEYSKWTFSGMVIDASTGLALEGAQISYLDNDGDIDTTETDENGNFYINNLPYGSRTFTFNYISINKKDTLYYTPKVFDVSSTNESSRMEGVVASASAVVRLSPLNATVTGELYINDPGSGKKIPVSGLTLSLSHIDSSYINIFPKTFATKTDSLGKFTFKKLPADTGLVLNVTDYTYKNIRYQLYGVALPKLTAGGTRDIGRAYLVQDTLIPQQQKIIASNVMDNNMIGYGNVSTLVKPYYVFAQKIHSSNLTVNVSADTSKLYVKPIVKDDTLFLEHDQAFPSEKKIVVSIVAYEKNSGNRIQMVLSGDSAFTTDRGLYAITSNVWPSNNKFKASFGTEDTMWVKFSEELDKNTDRIQWNYCSDVERTLYGNGFYANSKAWVKKDTVFVQMNEKILQDRQQGDSVGFNITIYAKNGMYAENFSLRTELVVPPQSSSSSESSSSSSANSVNNATSSSSEPFIDLSSSSALELPGEGQESSSSAPAESSSSNATAASSSSTAPASSSAT